MAELPAVDFRQDDAEERFVTSLHEIGFGVLSNHPLDEHVVTDLYARWGAFFRSGATDEYAFDPERHDGFFPQALAETAKGRSVRDIKEYFHYYPWGRCPPELAAITAAYQAATVDFAATLLGWVEKHAPANIAAGFSEPLPAMIEGSDQSLLRILHYPPIPEGIEAGAIRAGAHEDINLLTVLPAANEPGLQVKSRSGDWLDVPCDFGNLIINVGDMLQEASNGHFPSTTHRVVNPEGADAGRSRISLPLFLHPRPDVVLSGRYTAGRYLAERLAELRGEPAQAPATEANS